MRHADFKESKLWKVEMNPPQQLEVRGVHDLRKCELPTGHVQYQVARHRPGGHHRIREQLPLALVNDLVNWFLTVPVVIVG
jgi:hypothetical protein